MGLANPPPSAFPKGNTSVAAVDKSFAAGEANIAGVKSLIPALGGTNPNVSPGGTAVQTITWVGQDVTGPILQPGKLIVTSKQTEAVTRITSVSVISGDTVVGVDATGLPGTGYLYEGALLEAFIGPAEANEGTNSSVTGGSANVSGLQNSVVSGGVFNKAIGPMSGIVSGKSNHARESASYSFIGGGLGNITGYDFGQGEFCVISGGRNNRARGAAASSAAGRGITPATRVRPSRAGRTTRSG